MILEQIEGNGIGCNIVKNEVLSIGFGRFNNITSLETSISEKHALVGYRNGGYFVQDLGSRYGTFIKINQRVILRYGMILEIGSYQFMVVSLERNVRMLKLKKVYYCSDEE
jgi:pSer/pThr/pTyr-binding forkhead associated (FHA) protein